MRPKQDDSSKRKSKPDVPSTGRGAASAMDALIKRRVPPAPHVASPQPPKKGGSRSDPR
jgi:hypothetical protein